MRLNYSTICSILGCPQNLDFGDPSFDHVCIDSREVTPSALFACIKGSVTDGHAYASSAVSAGATVLLAEHEIPDVQVPVLVVPNTIAALQRLAASVRQKTKACVIGITGTCGKTTVKEMLASILGQVGKTAKSVANKNNQLGMACGILNTDGDEDFWVFEAGISHPGDMEELGAMLAPDIALIINAGLGHTEGLGEMGVAWHKAQLLNSLSSRGKGVVSADYPELVWKAYGTHKPLFFFSAKQGVLGSGPSVSSANYARWLNGDDEQGRYELNLQGDTFCVDLPLAGPFAAENVIAAALTAHLAGASQAAIQEGLRTVHLPSQRFVVTEIGNVTLIDDTYNANPLSMQCMLTEAARRANGRPLIFVLGEMRELGKLAASSHEALGKTIAQLAPTAVFWKGGFGDEVHAGLRSKGFRGAWLPITDEASFQAEVQKLLSPRKGFLLLAKGSRANHLETYFARVRELL